MTLTLTLSLSCGFKLPGSLLAVGALPCDGSSPLNLCPPGWPCLWLGFPTPSWLWDKSLDPVAPHGAGRWS